MPTAKAALIKNTQLSVDGWLTFSTGSSRKALVWHEERKAWSTLLAKLSTPNYTDETQAEFFAMDKERQSEIKDVGGFVGGKLIDGRRSASTIGSRQIITLDADYAPVGFWDMVEIFANYAIMCYSTHKHTPEKPRLRFVIPLNRPVTPDEYQAISRKVAEGLNMNAFDDTTYEPSRLMYWPSTSRDGEFFCRYKDGPWLNADAVLAEYDNWHDQSTWPHSDRVNKQMHTAVQQAEDPLTKEGLVGAFCRTYSIPDAIATFLPNVYAPFEGSTNRYTYLAGSSAGGAVVYDDKFLYSHHATDPCSEQLCNAFDLVRIHKFGALDFGKNTQEPTRLPSWLEMVKLCQKDSTVQQRFMLEKRRDIRERVGGEFESLDEETAEDLAWTSKLALGKTGKNLATRANIHMILENDPRIKGILGYDIFAKRLAVKQQPTWRYGEDVDKSPFFEDADTYALRNYIETYYEIDSPGKLDDEINYVASTHKFHPVREYLRNLQWDGKKRMDTLFINYLGAEDNAYVRHITRKTILAAVMRILHPGAQYDNVIVLHGGQGLGKTKLLRRMGKRWFSESQTTMEGKEGAELLQGHWIIELGELSAIKLNKMEQAKNFITREKDTYREAYARYSTDHQRQCIFIGTTNETVFLYDDTGNRRYFPIKVGIRPHEKTPYDADIDSEIDQIWAEAYAAIAAGEDIYIGKEMEEYAKKVQASATEENEYVGMMPNYVEKEVPENWYDMNDSDRHLFFSHEDSVATSARFGKRTRICVIEFWHEFLGKEISDIKISDRKKIRQALETLDAWELYRNGVSELNFGKMYGKQRAYVRKGFESKQQGSLYDSLVLSEG